MNPVYKNGIPSMSATIETLEAKCERQAGLLERAKETMYWQHEKKTRTQYCDDWLSDYDKLLKGE